ncbi:MAG: cobalt/nickel transport system permease protein [Solirubrobacteraceae bacterium]|jgi:cobalt/nickel transport system permease protein|nr:cobalt/nickel transport system permease protein [Solirubrobacteraceae bacterium]
MHIPDGFLTGQAALAGTVAGGAGLAYCVRRATAEAREHDLPVAGLAAAFFLVGDAPMFPLTVGTEGHLLGGTLAVALLGPWLGAITIAVVTAIQALAFGDGGITTMGLDVFNLALLPAFVGYPLILLLRRLLPLPVACGLAAFAIVVLASLCFVGEFALGSARAIHLGTVSVTVLGTYAVVGAIEGVVTGLIVRALLGVRPGLVRVRRRQEAAA